MSENQYDGGGSFTPSDVPRGDVGLRIRKSTDNESMFWAVMMVVCLVVVTAIYVLEAVN